MLFWLAENLQVKIILMVATKSLLDETKEEAIFEELIGKYFEKIKKYNQLKAQSVESIVNQLL